jgi:aryl-alcohol dehydrogenase-like predicted oxidoreductase
MRYRTLGNTGLRVSEIGFGCGNIGGLIIRAPLEERLAAFDRATELGINYFDTAAAYGNGRSEENLGEVLAARKVNPIIATKFGLGPENLSDLEGSIRRSLEASLKRLRRDSADIIQLHTPVKLGSSDRPRAIEVATVLGPGGVADSLDTLRSEGLFRFSGFTGLGETEALQKIIGSGRFDLVQSYFNLLNPSAVAAVPLDFGSQSFDGLVVEAARHNMGVAAIRVLAGGALGGPAARTGYAAPAVGGALVAGSGYALDLKRASKLSFMLKGEVNRLSQAAIRFVLGEPGVSLALVGFSSLTQIEEAAACSDLGPLPEADLKQLRELWSVNFGL